MHFLTLDLVRFRKDKRETSELLWHSKCGSASENLAIFQASEPWRAEVVKTKNSQRTEGNYGSVQVVELGDQMLSRASATLQQSLYNWRPIAALQLPANFKLSLACYTAANGERWFFPSPDAAAFLRKAALAGYAIGENRGVPSLGYRFSTAVMLQLFQQSPAFREHLTKSFKRESDLAITRSLQPLLGKHALPDSLGLTPTRSQTPWGIRELLDRGYEAALTRRVQDKVETRIRLGLLEAACLNPVPVQDLTEQETLSLVRRGLFGLGLVAGSAISQDDRERTMDRVLAALKKHVDRPTDAFKKWVGNVDNLVHAISKQKKGGGEIPREHVHQILLELVFSAHVFVADSMEVAMKDFAGALPVPLRPGERGRFSAVFFRQRALGGRSVVLFILTSLGKNACRKAPLRSNT